MTSATGRNEFFNWGLTSGGWQVAEIALTRNGRSFPVTCHLSLVTPRAFTLIELILVMALLVMITSLAAPAMSGFIRGRALDSEARRLFALITPPRAARFPKVCRWCCGWTKKQAPTDSRRKRPAQNGDQKAENLTLDSTLQIAVLNVRHGRADDVQQFAGHPFSGGWHGGRKQSADGAVDRFGRL